MRTIEPKRISRTLLCPMPSQPVFRRHILPPFAGIVRNHAIQVIIPRIVPIGTTGCESLHLHEKLYNEWRPLYFICQTPHSRLCPKRHLLLQRAEVTAIRHLKRKPLPKHRFLFHLTSLKVRMTRTFTPPLPPLRTAPRQRKKLIAAQPCPISPYRRTFFLLPRPVTRLQKAQRKLL